MRQTDDDLVVAYHNERESGRFYTDNTLFTILPSKDALDLKYLMALLNSKLLNFVYQSISQERGKSQAQVKVKNVRELPVVVPEPRVQKEIVGIVDKMLCFKTDNAQADASALELEIDALVYELYGLSDAEIAVIEGSQQ